MDYWEECIREAFEDSEITASKEQIENVIGWVEGAHENCGMATGESAHNENLRGSHESEIKNIQRAANESILNEADKHEKEIEELRRSYQQIIYKLRARIEELEGV